MSPKSSSTAGRSLRAKRCTASTEFTTSRCVRAIFSLSPEKSYGSEGRARNVLKWLV